MKALPPCQHFTEQQACNLGYSPEAHCALCQLYKSDWDAERTRLAAWMAMFGLAVNSGEGRQKIPFNRRKN